MTMSVIDIPPRTDEAPPASVPEVHCIGVHKSFRAGAQALRGIDLDCPAGRITVLLGPSGCGKTTLLRCIAGLESPSQGLIAIGGADVTTVHARERGVAMVFQNYGLYPDKSAFRNIEYPLRLARVPRAERRERVREMAELLQISHLLDRKPAQLSGGQRQRIGIGRALVRRPDVVLLDEPLSSLDAELRATMRTELHALQRRLGATMIYVTHDQNEALCLADQLVVMRGGRIEQRGGPEAVFTAPATTFVAGFLGGMNLLDAAEVEYDCAATTLGVRPEHLKPGITSLPGALTLRGSVVATELLGIERLIHVHIGHKVIRIRIDASRPIPTEVIAHAAPEHVHHFNSDGVRISPPTIPS